MRRFRHGRGTTAQGDAWLDAALFDTPIATVSSVEQHRVWLAAAHGLPDVREVGPEPGLCASAIAQDRVYVVNNACW